MICSTSEYRTVNNLIKIDVQPQKSVFKNLKFEEQKLDNFKDKIFKNACININKKSNRNFTTSLS